MKCYYHRQTEAIGKCKNCQKGLCTECAVDMGNAIACRDRCEDEVRAIDALMEKNKVEHQLTSQAFKRQAVIRLLMGAVLLIFGLEEKSENTFITLLCIGGGIAFILYAVLTYSSGREFMAK